MRIFWLIRFKRIKWNYITLCICIISLYAFLYVNLFSNISSPMANSKFTLKSVKIATYSSFSPSNISPTDRWHYIGNSTDICVYSAYFLEDSVRIIALWNKVGRMPQCFVWCSDISGKFISISTVIDVDVVPEHHGKRYKTVILSCKYNFASKMITPKYVSLGDDAKDSPNFYLQVHHPSSRENMFTVCVRAFLKEYNDPKAITAWIEMNKILGANRFAFYNYSIVKDANNLLWHYVKHGIADVVDWNEPVEDVWQAGQIASIYDCVFRYFNESKYIIHMDIDELIVPQKHTYWEEMIDSLGESDTTNFVFTNTIFPFQWTNQEIPNNIKHKLELIEYNMSYYMFFRHLKPAYPSRQRAKCIVNPRIVKHAGIHFTWSFKQGKQVVVHPSIGILQHYLLAKTEPDFNLSRVNKRMLFYQDDLIRKYDDQIESYNRQQINSIF